MGVTVDIERAHTADTLAAVVVEDERLLAFVDEFLVEDVEHLQEGSIIRDVVHLAYVEVALLAGTVLTPVFQCE